MSGKAGEKLEYAKQAGTDFSCFIMRLLVLCYEDAQAVEQFREFEVVTRNILE